MYEKSRPGVFKIKKLKLIFFPLLVVFCIYLFDLYPGIRKWGCSTGNECKCNDQNERHARSESSQKNRSPSLLKPHRWLWLSAEAFKKIQENECPPPTYNPFHPKMIRKFKEKYDNCSVYLQEYFFRVDDTNQEIVMVKAIPKSMKCCLSSLHLMEGERYRSIPTEDCIFIKQQRTKVPGGSHFLHIKCWTNSKPVISHIEAFVLFPRPSNRLLDSKARLRKKIQPKRHPMLNVIIIGFDSLSRMGFIREMNQTFNYLTSTLEVIDLHGYNKIGDATLNNTLAMLSGHDFGSVTRNKEWWNPHMTYFDKLPWIWKNFSDMGYITSVTNDVFSVVDFYFKGFQKQPTDYYINWIISWFEGRNRFNPFQNSSRFCFGGVSKYDILQNYVIRTSEALQNVPYFQYVWNMAACLGENGGHFHMADNGVLSMLRNLKTSGVLNKSLVMILSDHGEKMGAVMNLTQGRIENKMPFAFLILPKWFKEVYRTAYNNLYNNQYKLTTPYDIHSTLEDVLNPEVTLNDAAIAKAPLNQHHFGNSLFRAIPKNRTCESAGIDEEWCSCSTYKIIPPMSVEARKLASFAVDTIKSWLKPFSCVQYELDSVLSAEVKVAPSQRSKFVDLSQKNTFRIVFAVGKVAKLAQPPTFEVVVFTQFGWLQTGRDFSMESKLMRMSTEVFRISEYKGSPCMNVTPLRPICTCK